MENEEHFAAHSIFLISSLFSSNNSRIALRFFSNLSRDLKIHMTRLKTKNIAEAFKKVLVMSVVE